MLDNTDFLKTLTTRPGIYQMLDNNGRVLYIGKARNLKKRVSTYFRSNLKEPKTQALMRQVCDVSTTITASENEALLLESNLIKQLKPRYNILLRDDKSYPFLFLSIYACFPRLKFHRGAQREKGEYYGPYPSASAVHEALDLLQKLFKIRQCSDSFFKNRARPCLQYQIKRCTAPCVGYIDQEKYRESIKHARLFLKGQSDDVIRMLTLEMENASKNQAYEDAARYRDQITSLRHIQQTQHISGKDGDIDVIAVAHQANKSCIELLTIRSGKIIGSRSYYPKIPKDVNIEEIISEFLPQFYLSKHRGQDYPKKIALNITLADKAWLQSAISEGINHNLEIYTPKKGQTLKWMNMALLNAQTHLANQLSNAMNYEKWLMTIQTTFKLAETPERIECFDISHTLGEATVASCVVFGKEGPIRSDYRKFNIKHITPGDDYAAIKQALTRRYTRIKEKGASLPDILVVDGGKGQLNQAQTVLEELQIDSVTLLGIAKGEGRKPGLETLFLNKDKTPIKLPNDSPTLHLIQQIRDEAHRFAILGHRQQRSKARISSELENISGIGPKRRRALLKHFGGLQGIKNASIEDLSKVEGMQLDLAKRLYDTLH